MEKDLEPNETPTQPIDLSPLHEVLKSYNIPLDLSSEQTYYALNRHSKSFIPRNKGKEN